MRGDISADQDKPKLPYLKRVRQLFLPFCYCFKDLFPYSPEMISLMGSQSQGACDICAVCAGCSDCSDVRI